MSKPSADSPRRAVSPDGVAGAFIRVRGQVQGVGFRPAVWRLARSIGLTGEVGNDTEGVWVRVFGLPAAIDELVARMRHEPPPLARIDLIERTPLAPLPTLPATFSIAASRLSEPRSTVAPDIATCAQCLAEVFDSGDRRSGYAFTNCTQCGPRLSIVTAVPYDRASTSMAKFTMCPACRREYDEPSDRRFHAQPNACPDCGPRLWLESAGEAVIDATGDPIKAALRLLQAGHILAIKGVGGIHLACNAANADAVATLRRRKGRLRKPFALMARDLAMIRRYCRVGDGEAGLLSGGAAPVVLLAAGAREVLAAGVAPGQRCYGFLLPYTPLHHLLLAGLDAPIVLTSGNRSGEPQCIGNDEARTALADIADALLLHDRDIVTRVDDSVVRMIAGDAVPVRRARGFAPAPLQLPAGFDGAPPVLACGGDLKNTFCLLRDAEAVLSPHIGDLENAAASTAWRDTLARYRDLFGFRPQVVAVDAHPDYRASRLGREFAEVQRCRLEEVRHHHAHIAACLADNGVALDAPPVLGIALDGTGYGEDGTVWGGEFLLADYRGYRRLAALAPVVMPGAAQAIRQPWRMAFSHLRRLGDFPGLAERYRDLPFFQSLAQKPLDTLDSMIDAGFNSPTTSSCGRLFDAVAAAIGLCLDATYEGQAAMELEAIVDRAALGNGRAYPFAIDDSEELPRLNPAPMWRALLADLRDDVGVGVIAARFHAGLAGGLAGMVTHLAALHGDAWSGRVALSGGVFQNAVLSELLIDRLEAMGCEVLRHRRVPANDGGLSLGQGVVAAARRMVTMSEKGGLASP